MASQPSSDGDPNVELMHILMTTPGHQRQAEMMDLCSNEYGTLTYSSYLTFVPHDLATFKGEAA